MLSTKQKLEKLSKIIREIEVKCAYCRGGNLAIQKELLVYLNAWIDNLPDED